MSWDNFAAFWNLPIDGLDLTWCKFCLFFSTFLCSYYKGEGKCTLLFRYLVPARSGDQFFPPVVVNFWTFFSPLPFSATRHSIKMAFFKSSFGFCSHFIFELPSFFPPLLIGGQLEPFDTLRNETMRKIGFFLCHITFPFWPINSSWNFSSSSFCQFLLFFFFLSSFALFCFGCLVMKAKHFSVSCAAQWTVPFFYTTPLLLIDRLLVLEGDVGHPGAIRRPGGGND